MAKPDLPDNPTPEQLKEIVLNVIRTTFEDDAENVGDIESIPQGWKTTYEANGWIFSIQYTKKMDL